MIGDGKGDIATLRRDALWEATDDIENVKNESEFIVEEAMRKV